MLLGPDRDPAEDKSILNDPGLTEAVMANVLGNRRVPGVLRSVLVEPAQLVAINCKSCFHRTPAMVLCVAKHLEVLFRCRVFIALPNFVQNWGGVVHGMDEVLRGKLSPERVQVDFGIPLTDPKYRSRVYVRDTEELENHKNKAYNCYVYTHGRFSSQPRYSPPSKAAPKALQPVPAPEPERGESTSKKAKAASEWGWVQNCVACSRQKWTARKIVCSKRHQPQSRWR